MQGFEQGVGTVVVGAAERAHDPLKCMDALSDSKISLLSSFALPFPPKLSIHPMNGVPMSPPPSEI